MKARNKAEEAEQTSDLASEKEIENRRKRIQKVLYSSGSSDESILPSPPKRYAAEKAPIKAIDRKETEISLQSWLKRARERCQPSSSKNV
ncbi:hypothetical protein JTB14_016762 [Gonioctena quinquepunctata]|nr:hypothetical protein JTB14_016762 [Gonioctena quinquepunctata]